MYKRPYSELEIKARYPAKAHLLLKDPVHAWRAKTGIELIHKEPTKKEQLRIWKNWQQLSEEHKNISDGKSVELFGVTNSQHHQQILASPEVV